jgi:hypothetical protein
VIAEARQPAPFTRRTPVRGTQSFVAIMAAVWRRPSLVAIEVLWRWAAGIPLLVVCAWEFLRLRGSVVLNTAALQAMTVFKPVQAGITLSSAAHALVPAVLPILLWLLPAALLLRTVCATFGRTALLRRLQPGSHPALGSTFALSALRTVALLLLLTLWAAGIRWANAVAIIGPTARGEEPSVVLFAALVVFGTLALFVVWALSIWKLDAALFRASSRAVILQGSRTVRSQLIEMNLVMGIVKVALIVLAMVFSACPLPFETVESITFLTWWWIGVGVLYLLASDFFHVVRAAYCAAMLRLHEAAPDR